MSIYRFASFSLDTARYELTNEGKPVDLPRLPMDILILLLKRDGDLLTRTEIASTIWPESDPADVVPRINTAINRIRNSLGDDQQNPAFVQTVIGKGYRFVAPIETEGRQDVPASAGEVATAPNPTAPYTSSLATSIRGRTAWLMATSIVLALCIGGWLLWHRSHLTEDSKHAYSLARFTANDGGNRVTAAAIAPDGHGIAYADADGVRLKTPGQVSSDAVPTPSLREVDHIAWLPDEMHLMVSGVGTGSDVPQVWLLSTTGAAPVLWRTGIRKATPALHGTRIAFTDANDSIWVAKDLSQQPQQIFQGVTGEPISALVWTSNGKTLLAARLQHDDSGVTLVSRDKVHPRTSFFAFDTDTGITTVHIDNFRIDDACMEADGTLLFDREQLSASGIWEAPVNPATGVFLSPPQRVQVVTSTIHSLTIASTGMVAAVIRAGNPGISIAELHQMPASLDHVSPLISSANGAYPHAWTPDSTGLYFEQQQEDKRYRIFKLRLGSHDPEAVVSSPSDQAFPLLTPDHKWLLFLGRDDRKKPYELFSVATEHGTPSLVPVNGAMGEMRCPLQGSTCVLRRAEDHQRDVFYRLDPVSGIGKVLFTLPWVSDDLGGWDISPDASSLVLTSVAAHEPLLSVVNLTSGTVTRQPVLVHSRITAIRWAVDQKGWFITTGTPTGSDIFYLDPAGQLTLLRQTSGISWAVPSPDGHKVAFIDQNLDSNVWLLRR